MSDIGIVVIGRNEGERLRRSLESAIATGAPVIYVDSGSTDGSADLARGVGVRQVVELDPAIPFTAARGRNEGFAGLMETEPSIQLVQFMDGDCELRANWLATATAAMQADRRIAVVCGRLREKDRDHSIYRRLCDMEWNGPIGDIRASGGIAMVRASAFLEVGGFDRTLAAGEEAELCSRLRDEGHRIVRLADEMAIHDSGITRFEQWWGRAKRAGRAYAESLSRRERDAYKRRQFISALVWAGTLPLVAVVAMAFGLRYPPALFCAGAVLALYAALVWRVYGNRRRRGDTIADACLYSVFCVIGKWPQLVGQFGYWLDS